MGGRGASSSLKTIIKKPKEYKTMGNLDINMIGKYKDIISTNEIVLTNERSVHIYKDHPKDYDKIIRGIKPTLNNPNFVLVDSKKEDTLLFIRKLKEDNQNVVVKLNTTNDEKHPKNSIMTSWIINDKNLKRLLKKNKALYEK